MNLLNFYRLLPLAPLAINVCLIPYNLWIRTKSAFGNTWDAKNPLDNFAKLSNYTPKTLAGRVCPKSLYRLAPYIHQGNLGVSNRQEANLLIENAVNLASMGTGAAIAAIPAVKFFKNCFETNGSGTCAYIASSDFLSASGIQLFVGAYLISWIAKYSLIYPVADLFTRDRLYDSRNSLCLQEYNRIADAIIALLEKPSDDPLVVRTALAAKQFLRIVPYIERELHTGCALDSDTAAAIVAPLKAACRHLLIHSAKKTV